MTIYIYIYIYIYSLFENVFENKITNINYIIIYYLSLNSLSISTISSLFSHFFGYYCELTQIWQVFTLPTYFHNLSYSKKTKP